MVKKVHIYLIFAITVLMCLFMAGCKKKEVVYPPLLDEAQVLERLKEKYGEEFIIHKKTDLLSLGEVVKAPGPYSDIAEGIVYEASPENDPSFLFKVYTYRTYGNSSPIPFSKSGGLQLELEYYDCYGLDLLNQRFKAKAEKYGISYETIFEGFYDGYMFSEEANIARKKGEYDKFEKNLMDEKDYHIGIDYCISITEEDMEEKANMISQCILELMDEYHYEPGMYFMSWIKLEIMFKDENDEIKTTNYIGRALFADRGETKFEISKQGLIDDMKYAIKEKKNR